MTLLHGGLLLFAYFLGAIPFGVLVAKAKGVDIMSVGSKNIGTTNVWRTLGPRAGALVLLLDTLKGAVPALLAQHYLNDASWSFGAGMVAVIGHTLSPFLKFKGGKGIATGFGALLGSAPLVGILAFSVFLAVLLITRYVSLSSLFAAAALVILGFAFNSPPFVIGAYIVLAIFIVYRHRENIERLRQGTERRFEFKKKTPTEVASEPTSPE